MTANVLNSQVRRLSIFCTCMNGYVSLLHTKLHKRRIASRASRQTIDQKTQRAQIIVLPRCQTEFGACRVADLGTWLQGLGLAKYAKAFEENEIDFAVLPYLSDGMLQQIGLPIGPRAKLLAAIANLPASSRGDRKDTSEAAAIELQLRPRQEAERRQITVMFCDLVDSTKLATHLDPEELKSVLEAYHGTCAAIMDRYGGYVAQYSGDGILAYFGWPTAHEDAAERAVRAALDVVKTVRTVEGPEPLAVRAGIGTGIVVIGKAGLGDP